jgi:hypothetical protein
MGQFVQGGERAIMDNKPCTAQPASECEDCSLKGPLMCRYEARDTTHFFMIILPFFVTAIGGMIVSGYGWWLIGWMAYMLFFFFVWEARVLCSHCPYWAAEGRVLRCHANYGVIKIWRYRPQPMSRSEQVQFLAGVVVFILYPLIFLLAGEEYLLAAIGLASAASFGYLLRRNICSRCVNFSCPLNNVPKEVANAFLRRNPMMRQAWE